MSVDSNIQKSVLDILEYFQLFHFPLTQEEIHRYMDTACDSAILQHNLLEMVKLQVVYFYDNCYQVVHNKSDIIEKKAGYERAIQKIKAAKRISRFLNAFPFVVSVCVSGSLSKGYANKNSDIDYFIITKPNRLWISRTLLHLFKKVTFLVGKQNDFCMNYFIDSAHLELEEQNKFTAIELCSLIPLRGQNTYNELLNDNCWMATFVPNSYTKDLTERNKDHIIPQRKNVLDRLNQYLMHWTTKKWKKKWTKKGYPLEDYDLAFKSKLYVSKNHPANYQKKILKQYHEKN